jgi:hypothetical protein
VALIASLIELKSLWQPSQSSREVSSARTSPALYAEKFTFGLPGAIAIGSDAIQLYDRPTSGQTNGFKLLISCFKKEKKEVEKTTPKTLRAVLLQILHSQHSQHMPLWPSFRSTFRSLIYGFERYVVLPLAFRVCWRKEMKSKEEGDEESQIRDMKCVFFSLTICPQHIDKMFFVSAFAFHSLLDTKIMILLRYMT